jgi:hypothetical protein
MSPTNSEPLEPETFLTSNWRYYMTRKTSAKKRSNKCNDYMEVLKLQEKREKLIKEKALLEKRFSGLKIRIERGNHNVRTMKMKIESAGRRLKGRLSELNLLEERLMILERDPVNGALSNAEEKLRMINYNFREISINTVVLLKNVNRLKEDISNLKSGRFVFPEIKKASVHLSHLHEEVPLNVRKKIEVMLVKESEEIQNEILLLREHKRIPYKKDDALLMENAETNMN